MISRANRVITVAVTWLVIVFGCYFFGVARPGLGTRWEQYPPLPERAAAIELTRSGFVLVTTESDAAYWRYPWQTYAPWVVYNEATAEFYGGPCEADDGSRFGIVSPLGKVVARSSGDCEGSTESRFYAAVVLLENNEAWVWLHEYSGIGEAFSSIILKVAGAFGVLLLAIGWVIKLYDE